MKEFLTTEVYSFHETSNKHHPLQGSLLEDKVLIIDDFWQMAKQLKVWFRLSSNMLELSLPEIVIENPFQDGCQLLENQVIVSLARLCFENGKVIFKEVTSNENRKKHLTGGRSWFP